MTKKLSGKVAFVTGGSRGIGAAIAKRLADDGAAVAFTYASSPEKANDVVKSIENTGGRALAIHADSGNDSALKNAIRQTVQTLGGLDVLVNNAGIAVVKPVDELTMQDFDRMVAINIRAVFAAVKESLPHIKKGGRIITIGSCNADRLHFAGGSLYAMTKAAVAGLTRGLAHDLGPRGITVNTVQPGPTGTDMNPPDGPSSDALRAILSVGRYATPDEIAGMVSYLAGPDAGFVTGASLEIDGGYNA